MSRITYVGCEDSLQDLLICFILELIVWVNKRLDMYYQFCSFIVSFLPDSCWKDKLSEMEEVSQTAVSLPGEAGNWCSLRAEKYLCYLPVWAYPKLGKYLSLCDSCSGQNL